MKMNKIRILYSVLAALFFWLAWPMQDISILIFICFVPLLLLEDGLKLDYNSSSLLFRYTFFSFTLLNLACNYWIWNASAIGMIIAVLLNAFLMSLVFLAYHFVKKRTNYFLSSVFFISFWIAMEYFNHHWDFSFPWLTLGNAFANNVKLIQWYEYTGVFGGSFWILSVNFLLYKAINDYHIGKYKTYRIIKNLSFPIAIILVPILISLSLFSNYIEKTNPSNIVIAQPNIDPYREKFSGLSEQAQLHRLIHLSDSVAQNNTEFFIWPETALQNNLPEETLESNDLILNSRLFLSKYKNGNILTGADTYKTYTSEETITARKFRTGECCYDAFNTALLIENDPGIQIYHKSKLVAGVEQMPYPKLFKFLEPLALKMGGTFGSLGTQEARTVLYTKSDIGVAPVICYESVYGEFVAEYIKNGAQFIAIMTNDGWWGNTAGYKQHASYANLRAIETRRSIARSANTGISSFINQRGVVIQQTEYWKMDALNGNINLNEKITFYVKHGDWLAYSISLLSILILAYSFFKKYLIK